MEIGEYIKELLFIHDCVIIPGLGGFVANYTPAEVNEFAGTLSPPTKSILFNRNLIHNDGLLIGHVSYRTGEDYRKCEDLVKAYADRIMKSVADGNKYVVDDVGFFYNESGRSLRFQQEGTTNFLTASYGLSTVRLDPVEKEQQEFVPEVVYRASATPDRGPKAGVRRWVYTGVAASLIAAMVLIPVKTGYVEHMNFGWMNEKTNTQVVQQAQAPDQITPGEETWIEPPAQNFHIIVGSFKDFSNARRLHNQLSDQGHEPQIMEASNGYYRVAILSTGEAAIASDKLNDIRKLTGFESAWILKE